MVVDLLLKDIETEGARADDAAFAIGLLAERYRSRRSPRCRRSSGDIDVKKEIARFLEKYPEDQDTDIEEQEFVQIIERISTYLLKSTAPIARAAWALKKTEDPRIIPVCVRIVLTHIAKNTSLAYQCLDALYVLDTEKCREVARWVKTHGSGELLELAERWLAAVSDDTDVL